MAAIYTYFLICSSDLIDEKNMKKTEKYSTLLKKCRNNFPAWIGSRGTVLVINIAERLDKKPITRYKPIGISRRLPFSETFPRNSQIIQIKKAQPTKMSSIRILTM